MKFFTKKVITIPDIITCTVTTIRPIDCVRKCNSGNLRLISISMGLEALLTKKNYGDLWILSNSRNSLHTASGYGPGQLVAGSISIPLKTHCV
ncbi:UNVERIFIED_CONTAM: hypothetical protein NCL1_21411 [Trichonephila clavipes]